MTEARVAMGVAGLVILTVALVALLVIANRRLRELVAEQRRLHLQQANIIAMLLRAGFRGPRAGLDWGDSGHLTRVRDEIAIEGSVRQ